MLNDYIYSAGRSAGNVKCDICDKNIPKAHMRKHLESAIHEYNVLITNYVLERSQKLVNCKNLLFEPSNYPDSGYYCDTCNSKYMDENDHFKSEIHIKLNIFKEILPEMYVLFKDAANHLDSLEVMRKALNKLEAFSKHNDSSVLEFTTKVQDKVSVAEIVANKTYCDVCKVYKATSGFDGHLNSKKHKSNVKAQDSVNRHVIANITKIVQDKTYCDVCKVYKATSGFDGHLNSKKHQSNVKAQDSVNRHVIANITKIVQDKTYCDVCKVYKATSGFDRHLNSKKHQSNVKAQGSVNFSSVKHQKKIGINDTKKIVNEECKVDFPIGKHLTDGHDEKYIVCDINLKTFCNICNIDIEDDMNEIKEHIQSVKHMIKYKNLINDHEITKVVNEYFCPKCNYFFDDIVEHLKLHNISVILVETYCKICKVEVPHGGLTIHKMGKRHLINEKVYDNMININYIDVDLEKFKEHKLMITVKYKTLTCKICDVPLEMEDDKHFENSMHMVNLIVYARKNCLEPAANDQYFCSLCDFNVDKNLAYAHIQMNH